MTTRAETVSRFTRRGYVAGGGATGALLAGAVLVFVAMGAFVAFDKLPLGGHGGASGSVEVVKQASSPAATAASVALRGTPAAVAATPAAPAVAPAGAPGAGAPVAAASGPNGGVTAPAGGTGPGGVGPSGGTGGGAVSSGPADLSAHAPGAVSGTVSNLDNATGNLGLDLQLGPATNGITKPLDDGVTKTLNGVGGKLGNPDLGTEVGAIVTGATGTLLGHGHGG